MNRRTVVKALMLGLIGSGGAAGEAAAAKFQDLNWSYRPVLIFAPHGMHPALRKQRAVFEAVKTHMIERDMALYGVAGETVDVLLGPAISTPAGALRRRYGIAPDAFAVLLVGKDGGEKLRSDVVTGPDRIFALIDTMPMRRREIRERSDG